MSKPTTPTLLGAAMVAAMLCAPSASAQVLTGAPLPVVGAPPAGEMQRSFDSAELDRILSPIALYPDPLLAQVLSAATFAPEIPVAAQWVNQWRGRSAEQLVAMLAAERVTWDPSVQALVAFPTVLQMMTTSMSWTTEVGDAFRLQRGDVMDAVQRLRVKAQDYGYLNSTSQIQVVRSPAIEILPVNPAYVVVPYYDPVVVFAPPRPRFLVSSAIYLGFGVRLGYWYEPWGWRSSGFYWPTRHIVGGYPGWNRPYGYRPVYVNVRRDEPRYGYSYGSRDRDDRRYDNDDRNRSSGWGTNRGGDNRNGDNRNGDNRSGDNRGNNGNRESQSTGRTAQPRQAQPQSEQPRVIQRVMERARSSEVQRSNPQSSSREAQRSSPERSSGGNSESRTARRRN